MVNYGFVYHKPPTLWILVRDNFFPVNFNMYWIQCMLTLVLIIYILLFKGKSIYFLIHKSLINFAIEHLFINTQ